MADARWAVIPTPSTGPPAASAWHLESPAEVLCHGAAPIDADAMMVGKSAPGASRGPDHRVPRLAVVGLHLPCRVWARYLRPGRPAGEGEIEAGAIGVGVGLM